MGVPRAQTSVVGQGSAIVIPGSTTFDDATSDYLTKTPSYEGNRMTWTISVWVKRCEVGGSAQYIFETGTSDTDSDRFIIRFDSSTDRILVTRGQYADKRTTAAYRDTNGWYHICVVADTAHSTASERLRLYVNGERITDFANDTDPAQNFDMGVCRDAPHNWGRSQVDGGGYINAYMSHAYLLDSAALEPTYFGFTDPLTGSWRPKSFKATNGFGNINDGTVWSSNTCTGTPYSGQSFTSAFDGKMSTYVHSEYPGVLKWVPPNTINGKLRAYIACGAHGGSVTGNFDFKINGVSHFNNSTFPNNTSGWVDFGEVSVDSGGDVIEWGSQTGGNWMAIRIFEIDGFRIVDSDRDNSFYLPFDGTGYSAFQTAGNRVQDQSGNQNNFTSSGSPTFSLDSPSGAALSVDNNAGITTTGVPTNYCILNSVSRNAATNNGGVHLTKGNLRWYSDTQWAGIMGTVGANTGKWYYEVTHAGGTAGYDNAVQIGVAQEDHNLANDVPAGGSTVYRKGTGWISSTGAINSAGGHDGFGTWGNGDTVGCAFDIDEKKIWFHKNGTWILSRGGTNPASGSIGDPALGTHPIFDPSTESSYAMGSDNGCDLLPMIACQRGKGDVNFGQKPFAYAPPKGFKHSCTANIPQTGVVRPDQFVGATLYSGSGSGAQYVSAGFKPDMVWIKSRNNAWYWNCYDSVRGSGKDGTDDAAYYIGCNDTSAQSNVNAVSGTQFQGFYGGDTYGGYIPHYYTGGSGQELNTSGATYVGYCWKAGGGTGAGGEFWKDDKEYASAAAVGLSAGTITPSGASVGTKQGFSIIKYTGTDNTSDTFAHGLSQKPDFAIFKNLSQSGDDWIVYHSSQGATKRGKLNLNNSFDSQTSQFNDTEPTSSLFTIGTYDNINKLNENYIS